MQLADHIRPLLRDHDCVIIPDFGGLVADVSPARTQPGRQALSPPTKLVAFNQALTRNDGLLVDALSHHTGISIAEAREVVRTAVANLQQELDETNRTELPGIGIFRRATGRGLAFEYTGTDNLLASAFGLPELAARPVRVGEARLKGMQPALRGAGTRRSRWARLAPVGIIAVAASLLVLVNIQVMQNVGYLPASWASSYLNLAWPGQRIATPAAANEPQLATLGQHTFASSTLAAQEGITPLNTLPSAPVSEPVLKEVAPTRWNVDSASVSPAPNPASQPALAATAVPTPAIASPEVAAATPSTAASVPVAPQKTANKAVAKSTTIKSRTGRYYVIAGAYSNLAHAERGRRNLVHAGHDARIILPYPGSRLFRLAAADYPDQASAEREAKRLRTSTHCDYITLKF